MLSRELEEKFCPLKRHCFVIEMTDGFDLFHVDVGDIVHKLNSYVPSNRSVVIKVVDGKIIIYEFTSSVRMKVNTIVRNDCIVKRVKFGDLYNYFTTFDTLDKIEITR